MDCCTCSLADDFHANPGIVTLALALPLCGAALWRRGGPGHAVAVAATAVLVLLTVYGVANRSPPRSNPCLRRRSTWT